MGPARRMKTASLAELHETSSPATRRIQTLPAPRISVEAEDCRVASPDASGDACGDAIAVMQDAVAGRQHDGPETGEIGVQTGKGTYWPPSGWRGLRTAARPWGSQASQRSPVQHAPYAADQWDGTSMRTSRSRRSGRVLAGTQILTNAECLQAWAPSRSMHAEELHTKPPRRHRPADSNRIATRVLRGSAERVAEEDRKPWRDLDAGSLSRGSAETAGPAADSDADSDADARIVETGRFGFPSADAVFLDGTTQAARDLMCSGQGVLTSTTGWTSRWMTTGEMKTARKKKKKKWKKKGKKKKKKKKKEMKQGTGMEPRKFLKIDEAKLQSERELRTSKD